MKKLLLLLLFIPLVFSCSKETIKYNLTTSVNPIEGGDINPNGGIVDEGTQISIAASPAAEYLFDKWSGAASGSSPSISVIMDSDKSVTANFIKKKYALTTTVEGEGIVTEKVIKVGAATDYNSGTIVELKAIPSNEWEFKEWKGDVTSSENPTQITIDKAKSVTAVFVKKQYPLTIKIEGEGTVIIKIDNQIQNAEKYDSGTILEITAVAENEYDFEKWSGDIDGSENPVQITIDKAMTITAEFESKNYTTSEYIKFSGFGNALDEIGIKDEQRAIINGLNIGHTGEIVITDYLNYRVLRYNETNSTGKVISSAEMIGLDNASLFTNGVTIGDYYGVLNEGINAVINVSPFADSKNEIVFGNNGSGDELNQLKNPQGMTSKYLSSGLYMYVADTGNHRVLRFKWSEKIGEVVAGGNGGGSELNQLYNPSNVEVDNDGNVYVADMGNGRIIKWEPNANEGLVVSEICGFDIAMDDNYLYTSIQGDNPSVYRINKNDKDDIILISGGNGKGSELNQYENPAFIDIDSSGNIFVSDDTNLRIMKISKN
jgi:sugar lactone lactonase YvrE